MGDDYDGEEDRRRTPRRRANDLAEVNGVVGWRLGQLENNLDQVERELDKRITRAELEQLMKARDAILDRRFMPRDEAQARRDWTIRIYGIVLTAIALLEPFLNHLK